MRGLDLVWESATPPTHIWERSPKKKRFFFWQPPLPFSAGLPMITDGLPFTADSNDVSIISRSKATSLCKRRARNPKKLVPEKPTKWERCSTSSVEGDQKDQQDQPKHCKHWENKIWRSRDKMRTVIALRGWES